MKRVGQFLIAALFMVSVASLAQDLKTATKAAPAKTPKLLSKLTKDELSVISHVQIKGDTEPELIYIPIIHDGPYNHLSSSGTVSVEKVLGDCQKIGEHLYDNYGVRNILLEGIGKSLSDKYNSPKYRGKKLSVGKSKMVTWKVWFDILNKKQWNLVPAYEKKSYGPVTKLGIVYSQRIYKVMQTAHGKGMFRSKAGFVDKKAEFQQLVNTACKGYNEKLDALIKADPGLKGEYKITVTDRNKVFLDNTMAAKGPGIIMCGGGHVQDLLVQLEKSKKSFMVIVPKGVKWPPAEKDDKKIYEDMLKLGCQLKKTTLRFGDGGSANVVFPIK